MSIPSNPLQYQMLINGSSVEAGYVKRFQRESLAHDVVVGDHPLAAAGDVDSAVRAARNDLPNFSVHTKCEIIQYLVFLALQRKLWVNSGKEACF
jgi:hypothetical protein